MHQQQEPLEASDSGGFCVKMFFFTSLDPSARRLGVSKICQIHINHQMPSLKFQTICPVHHESQGSPIECIKSKWIRDDIDRIDHVFLYAASFHKYIGIIHQEHYEFPIRFHHNECNVVFFHININNRWNYDKFNQINVSIIW